MAFDAKRFTARFVEEAREHVRHVEDGLAALKTDPSDQESLNAIFRSAHTVKGSARMLKFEAISQTAHHLEDVLGAMRDQGLPYSPELGRLLARAVDGVAGLIERIASGEDPGDVDQALCADLIAALSSSGTPSQDPVVPPATSPPVAVVSPPTSATPGERPAASGTALEVRIKAPDTVRVSLDKLDDLIKLLGEVVSSHARLRQRLLDLNEIERRQARDPAREATGEDVDRARALREFGRNLKDDVLAQELLMEELHGRALIMRMLPLGMVFDAAPRLIRDLGRSVGKEVECVVSGAEIELDRQLIDRLDEPIVHLLRNAVDHGIEDPALRQSLGKPGYGTVRLLARQDAGGVAIEVSDDGAGVSIEAIRQKAVRKGLMTADQVTTLSDDQALDLIFLPGFSTQPIITDISGRGVGMDVVKSCIVDDLQGSIRIETQPGKGTSFILRLPLSLAVMRVLLVEAGGEILGFTAQQVAHLLRVPASRLVLVADRQAIVLDNEIIPVIGLANLLSLPDKSGSGRSSSTPGAAHQVGGLLLVIIQVRNEKLALAVDALVDERDMVIKPLPPHLGGLAMVSGMVLTGQKQLVSILSAHALLAMAGQARLDVRPGRAGESVRISILVVDDSWNTREIEKDVLEAHGYEVTLAEDGRDGLQKAQARQFDAVLTDVEMPHMDGFTLTATLRADERYRSTPILIITSRQKEEDKRRGIEVGADAYIVKGDFDQGSLVDTLRALLG